MRTEGALIESISIPVKEESGFELHYTHKELQRGGILGNILRSSSICALLILSVVFSTLWLSGGPGWAYGSYNDVTPLFECPAVLDSNPLLDAGFCKVTLSPWSEQTYNQILYSRRYASDEGEAKTRGLCLLPVRDADTGVYTNSQDPINCWSKVSCSYTTDWKPLNPYSVSSIANERRDRKCGLSISGLQFTLDCFQILRAEAFCDEEFRVGPGQIVSVRGVSFGIILLWFFLVIYDVYIWLKIRGYNRSIFEYRASVLDSSISAKRNELLRRCHLKWSSFVSSSIHSESVSSYPRTCSFDSAGGASPKVGSLPYQPVLTPRTSVVFESKASPTGYSPRLDSPPVGVMTRIQSSTTRLTRFNGSIESLFSSGWRRRVANSFKIREFHLSTISLSSMKKISHLSLCLFVLLTFYTLCFWILLLTTSQSKPASMTTFDLISIQDGDRIDSFGQILIQDLFGPRLVALWMVFLAFLDVFLKSFCLCVFVAFSTAKPTDLSLRDSIKNIIELELENKPKLLSSERLVDETQVSSFSESQIDSTEGPKLMTPPSLRPTTIMKRRPSFTSSSDFSVAQVIDGGYDQRCTETFLCALVSVMSPCSTESRKVDFIRKLKSLQRLMPNDEDIFVVDCGRTRQPIDDTEFVICRQVSDRIHYIYFPEPDRLLALYWTSKYWIPFQFSSNRCGDYIYSLILDETVLFPSNFLLPDQEYLLANPKIKAMYIPTTENLLDDNSNNWIARMREAIELVSIYNIAGSTTHAGSGCPQIWERNTFEMTCFNLEIHHDQQVDRALCLEANGRALLKKRDYSLISVYVNKNGVKPLRCVKDLKWTGIPTYQSIPSYIRELIDPSAIWHLSSLLGKPFSLCICIDIFFDSVRVFVAAVMLLRDPLGFALVSILVGYISILPLVVNQALSTRFEQVQIVKFILLLLVQPVATILVDLPVRMVRLFKLKIIPIVFSTHERDETIGEREEEFRDLPVVPLHPCPHWASVWM